MYLEIGGVCYPAAPFNGWYMGTEIGSRNLADSDRYNQLPVIAAHMGLTTDHDRNLWKDKALTELNLAVLHSYAAAGVTITDHHTESARFLQHIDREERHGRTCPADWTWIVPPAASSATPVFHRYYQDFDQTPNFYRHPALVAPALSAQERADRQTPARQPHAKEMAAPETLREEGIAQGPARRPSVARELASRLIVQDRPGGPSVARELVSQLIVQEPARRPSVPREQMPGRRAEGPAARELASRPPAVQGPAPRQPAAWELASRLPADQEPASKGPAAPELASGPLTTLDVVVEGSATSHDHLQPAGGICPRAGGDLRR
jgi:hypothetical protein